MERYVFQMVVFQKYFCQSGSSLPFYVSYEFADFSTSARVARLRCADYVSYLVKNHVVLSAQPCVYSSKDESYEVLFEVVDDEKVEYYGFRKCALWSHRG